MLYLRIHNRISKICALIAATLIIPMLAYAGTDHGKGNKGQNNGKQNGHDKVPTVSDKVPAVPEGGPGIVLLITTIGAILVFSARLSSRKEA